MRRASWLEQSQLARLGFFLFHYKISFSLNLTSEFKALSVTWWTPFYLLRCESLMMCWSLSRCVWSAGIWVRYLAEWDLIPAFSPVHHSNTEPLLHCESHRFLMFHSLLLFLLVFNTIIITHSAQTHSLSSKMFSQYLGFPPGEVGWAVAALTLWH